jgi:sialic acid synthase SpsE
MRCTDLDGLLYWRERNIGLDTIFSPSALALLEANERTRQTLVLARDLAQGEILTETDLASAVGGPGLGADRRDIVIGLRALYPLKAGTPVDFGLIG